jgi:tetratricopeptide (TPR) repeat protein/TM2 domain-containing membrane protein YozV
MPRNLCPYSRFGIIVSCIFLVGFCISFSGVAFSATGEGLYESRLDKGLSNTEPYSYLLMERARENNGRAWELLSLAKRYSPDFPPVYFELAREDFSLSGEGVFEGLDYFRQGIRAYARNFWWEFSLVGLLYKSLILSFIFSLLFVLIVRLVMDSGLVFHDGAEDRRRLILLVVPIVLSLFGPVGLISGIFFVIGSYFRKENKAVVYASLLFFLASPILLNLGERLFSAPSAGLRAIVAVNEGKDNEYALWVNGRKGDFASRFSYALALKREGRYEEAIEAYRSLTTRSYKQDPRVFTNLGNAYYAVGDMKAAMDSYDRSIEMRPGPAALYNLSQLYRVMLDFKKGDEYFQKAARLNPAAVSRFTSIGGPTPNRFVVDETLPISRLWEYAIEKQEGNTGTFPVVTILAALCAMSCFYLVDRSMRYRAHRCSRCGAIFCSRCSRTLTWGEMCPRCYRSLIKIEEVDSRERIAGLLSIHRSQARRRKVARVLSYTIPGVAQIYTGRILSGMLLLWLFLSGGILLVLSRMSIAVIVPFTHRWTALPAIAFMGLIYVVSIFSLRRRISRGWL